MILVLNLPFTAARSCWTPSLFFTVTGVPTLTVNLSGRYLYALIVTDVTGVAAWREVDAAAAPPAPSTRTADRVSASSTATTAAANRVVSGRLGRCDMPRA